MSLLEQARTHINRQEWDLASQNLLAHLNNNFHDDVALYLFGGVLLEKGQNGLAATVTNRAIEIRKAKGASVAPVIGNLASAYKAENRPEQAEELWKLALELEDDPAERSKIFSNLSGCHINEGRAEQAIAYLDEALRLRPDNWHARYNRGLAHLEVGNWRQGWQDFGYGFQSGDRAGRRYRDLPEWDGSPDQRVIVWGDQGVGDEILFASIIPDMVKHSKHVIFDCHPRLVETFKRSFPGVDIHGTRKVQGELDWLDDVEADASICISSLPRFFRNCDQQFPGKPFLKRGPHAPLPVSDRPRIGLAWAGGTKKTRNDLRSIPLEQLVPVLRAVDADFYSLQYTPSAAREVCELEEATGIRIRHYPGWVECKDYDKTISFVASLDLTITCCTAIHHASNAVGTPTWTLVPNKPAWRYGEKGHLWYHTTNVFYRQEPGETWAPVIDRVAADLREAF